MIYLYDSFGPLCYITERVRLDEAKAFAQELSYNDDTVYTVILL